MRIFASYNIKGGVGKTATAVNLAYLAACEGARTLVWDLDPQGAASFYFRIKPKVRGGSKTLVQHKRGLDDFIKGTDYENLDLMPADFSYRNLDLEMEDTKKPTRHVRKLLKPLMDQYEYVFLDCAPSISLVSENVFQAADALLVPTIPTTLSLRTLEQLEKFRRKELLTELIMLPFFSMVDRRKQLHRDILEQAPHQLGMIESFIPYASEVERMGVERAVLASFAGSSRAAQAYQQLWAEIKGRIG